MKTFVQHSCYSRWRRRGPAFTGGWSPSMLQYGVRWSVVESGGVFIRLLNTLFQVCLKILRNAAVEKVTEETRFSQHKLTCNLLSTTHCKSGYLFPGAVHNDHRTQDSQKSESFTWWAHTFPHLMDKYKPFECIQEQGEILYIPSGWWWSNLNTDDSITLQVRYIFSKFRWT